MIEKGIRGGISMVCKRYAKANNRYLDTYDPDKPNVYILYLVCTVVLITSSF